MQRNNNQNTRYRGDSDGEDDDYLNTSLSTTSIQSVSPAKAKRAASDRHDDSSDDSDDQLDKRMQTRGSNKYTANFTEHATVSQQKSQPVASTVRKVPSSRGVMQREASNSAMGGAKSFVPKDINTKKAVGEFRAAVSRAEEQQQENPNFGRVPRKFLEEPEPQPQLQASRSAPPADNLRGSHTSQSSWSSAKGREQPRGPPPTTHRNNSSNSNHRDSRGQQSSPYDEDDEQLRAEEEKVNEEEEDEGAESEGMETGSQVSSSNTVEEFDAPTPDLAAAKKLNKHNLLRRQAGEDQQSGLLGNDQNLYYEEQAQALQLDARWGVAATKATAAKVPPKGAVSGSRDVGGSGSFAAFAEQSLAQGVTLPRKSGRYTEGDAGQQDGEEQEEDGGDADNWLVPDRNSNKNNLAVSSSAQPAARPYVPSAKFSFVLVAHPRGLRTEHVQCTVRRDRTSMQGKLYPTYEMILDDPQKTLIIARKMNLNRTSNYHLFDMTRGAAGSKLSKKNGNYLGKLRAKNMNRTAYVLLNQSSEREELAGVLFDRLSFLNQLKDGNQPRKMKVLVPSLDENNIPIPNRTSNDSGADSLSEKLAILDGGEIDRKDGGDEASPRSQEDRRTRAGVEGMYAYQSKDPVFENGNYRLNFNGRVSMPSVKNYQLVSAADIDDIVCQFGKVEEDAFHLDYKAPLNAVQAFAFALCQFNL